MEPQSIQNGSTPASIPDTEKANRALAAKEDTGYHFCASPEDSTLNTSLSPEPPAPIHSTKLDTDVGRAAAEEVERRPITEVIGEKVKTWWNSLRPFDQAMGIAWTGVAFLEASIALMSPVGSTPFMTHMAFSGLNSLLAAVHFLNTKEATSKNE